MSKRLDRIFLWIFHPQIAEQEEQEAIMANQKLHDAVSKLKADDAAKAGQIAQLTNELTAATAAVVPLQSEVSDLTSKLATATSAVAPLQAQVDALTKSIADNDADDNTLADSLVPPPAVPTPA